MTDYLKLEDDQLIGEAERLGGAERSATAELIACLCEVKRRKDLLLSRGYAHLFDFCVRRLHMSEGAAAKRVAAARAASRFPASLTHLREGSISLWTLARVEPYLEAGGADALLSRAAGLARPQIEELVLCLGEARRAREAEERQASTCEDPPQPALFPVVPDDRENRPEVLAARSPDSIKPVGPDIVRVSFDASVSLRGKLERAGTLLSHRLKSRRLDELIEALADAVLKQLEASGRVRRKPALGASSRRVPWWVRKDVWQRDGARCAYTAADGTRCSATRRLQYDHVVPWAMGGRSDDPANIRLLCRAHNLREGRKAFPEATARALAARATSSVP